MMAAVVVMVMHHFETDTRGIKVGIMTLTHTQFFTPRKLTPTPSKSHPSNPHPVTLTLTLTRAHTHTLTALTL